MFALTASMSYYLYAYPTDMRKSFYTLSGIVTNLMRRNVQDGEVFIFINRSCTSMKVLHMECGGLVIYHMRLESGTFTLPVFDEDIEAASGLPEGARKLKALLRESDGFLIASPEYNSSITAALKNAIDWASRSGSEDEPPLTCYRGKVAALCSASPGALGGMRGLVHLRAILGNIGVIVLPEQLCIPTAHEAFDAAGKLKDARKAKQLASLARGLVEFLSKLKSK